MALIDGLQSYYKLDEVSGTRADSHGAINLSEVGGARLSGAGWINNACSFEGSTSKYLDGGDHHLYTAFTASCWVNKNILNTGAIDLIAYGTGSWPSVSWTLYLNTVVGSNQAGTIVNHTSGFTTLNNTAVVLNKVGKWYHVVSTYTDAGTRPVQCFVNNVKAAGTTTSTIKIATYSFRIGGTRDAGLNGLVDEVGIWNRVLTDTEIAELYNFGAGNGYPFGNSTALKFRS